MLLTQPSDDDHMAVLYPDPYTNIVPQQGDTKRRRRRKKSKAESGSGKRKLSAEQVRLLELNFGSEHKLESERKDRLASELGLDPRQVAVWFQNRRARWKTKRLEEEYSNLKSLYDNLILDKYQIESEVLKLKEQLSEAEEEIQRLSVSDRTGNSPSSSYSVDVTSIHQQQFFGMEQFNDVLYMPIENYGYGVDQWINIYD